MRLLLLCLATALLASCGRVGSGPTPTPPTVTLTPEPQTRATPEPNPALSPLEVVQIQVEAMQANDDPTPDSGIRTAFRFASPSNRESTGPLARFIELVKNPQYRALLDAQQVEYGETDIQGETAMQPVMVINTEGEPVVYLFALSRQAEAPYEDCWMTDAVLRLDSQPQRPLDEA
jgi:hypothetical protein